MAGVEGRLASEFVWVNCCPEGSMIRLQMEAQAKTTQRRCGSSKGSWKVLLGGISGDPRLCTTPI